MRSTLPAGPTASFIVSPVASTQSTRRPRVAITADSNDHGDGVHGLGADSGGFDFVSSAHQASYFAGSAPNRWPVRLRSASTQSSTRRPSDARIAAQIAGTDFCD